MMYLMDVLRITTTCVDPPTTFPSNLVSLSATSLFTPRTGHSKAALCRARRDAGCFSQFSPTSMPAARLHWLLLVAGCWLLSAEC